MSEEDDIGLCSLNRRSSSIHGTPTKRTRATRRPSIVTIVREEEKTPIKSPSNPNLVSTSPKTSSRKLSRSNTLPRTPRADSFGGSPADDLDSLSITPTKALQLRRWIIALVVVDFDLDYGPKLTKIYPPLDLTDAESGNIAFASFPDSPQLQSGSYIHSFRVRQPQFAAQLPESSQSSDGFVYGFSHFTQRRDSSSKRGYQQRSLVILSQHPYPSLFYTILSYLGQSFLAHGGPMLETAGHNIATWSDPVPGSTMELGFLGYVFSVELPMSRDAQQSSKMGRTLKKYDPDTHILASLSPQDPPIIAAFRESITHIWSIWECLLLCEPILVFGPSAAVTSQVVWWLRDVVRPIPFAGDFRPFFTIHDVDHTALANSRQPQTGLMLGVTNPFFERTCSHWPHILSLSNSNERTRKASQNAVDISVGPQPGWRTRTHKRHIAKDQTLLKRLEDACKGDENAKLQASEALREHLTSRTTAFLVPLQRYLNTLIPTPADRSAPPTPSLSMTDFASTGSLPHLPSSHSGLKNLTVSISAQPPQLRLKPFNDTAFLASLKTNGSPLPFKSNAKRKEFYERWLRTRAFGLWLAAQEEVVDRVLATPFLSSLPSAASAR